MKKYTGEAMEWRLVKKSLYGKTPVLEGRYIGEPWQNWFFRTSTEKKHGWIYMPKFKLWRCNVSI